MFGAIRSRVLSSRVTGRRNMGGWLKTNVRTEENAGLREASYKTWEFDPSSVPRLILYMFVPGTLFYFTAKDEMVSTLHHFDRALAPN